MTLPKLFDQPWANAGIVTAISDTVTGDGTANYPQGWTNAYQTAIESGGKTVSMGIMNQLCLDITNNLQQWQYYTYPTWYSTVTYAQYSEVIYTDGVVYQSLVNSNTSTPGTDLTKWFPKTLGNSVKSFVNVSTTGGTVSLTQVQSLANVIELSGTLASNATVQLSSTGIKGDWLVWNNTSGAYTLTFGYASGTTVTIPQGTAVTVYGDGTNTYTQSYALTNAANTFTQSQTVQGNVTLSKSASGGNVLFQALNNGTGASTYAGFYATTGTANSIVELYLNDNSGSPTATLSIGSAVTAFTLPAITSGTTASVGNNTTLFATTAYTLNSFVGATGQAYTDVTASRAIGTTYTNSTNRPIYVAVEISTGAPAGSYSATLTIGGNLADASGLYLYTGGTNTQLKLTGVVGIGETYTVTSSSTTLTKWYERR